LLEHDVRGTEGGLDIPHRLFIVARGHDRLFDDLRQQFHANPDVEVLIDRRHAERRQSQDSHDPERRRRDRRDQGPAGGHVVSAGVVPGLPILIVELTSSPAP
jgi:hypothetical protein